MQKFLTDTVVWRGKMYVGGTIHTLPDDLVEAMGLTPPENLELPKPPNAEEEAEKLKEQEGKKNASRKSSPLTEL